MEENNTAIVTATTCNVSNPDYVALAVNTVAESGELTREKRVSIAQSIKGALSLAHTIAEGAPFTVVNLITQKGLSRGDASKGELDRFVTQMYFVIDDGRTLYSQSEGIARDLADYISCGIIEPGDGGNIVPTTFCWRSVALSGGRTVKRLELVG